MITIQRDDQVAGGRCEAPLIASSVASDRLTNYLGAKRTRHVRSAVGRAVIHYNHLVDELRHAPENALDSLLFVEARDDHCNALRFIHSLTRAELYTVGRCAAAGAGAGTMFS